MNQSTSVSRFHWDPFSPPREVDIYEVYRILRDHHPVHFNPERGYWSISRYEDVRDANRDWQRFSSADGIDLDGVGLNLNPGAMINTDPPEHTGLRSVIRDYFRAGSVRQTFDATVRDEVGRLLDPLREPHGQLDAALDFAWMLPIRISAHMLGYPFDDCETLRTIANRAVFMVEPQQPIDERAANSMKELREYFAAQVDDRRLRPREDLLSVIANSTVDGRSIGDSAAGIASLIFAGAYATSAFAITSAINLLATHPEQRQALVEGEVPTSAAVEEVLRFESPAGWDMRTTRTDVTVRDTRIPADSPVVLMYGAANRDDRQFPNADTFDIAREGAARHLSFGGGIHLCIGAPLARLEIEVAIETLLERAPRYELAGEPKHLGGGDRGFLSLPIQW